MKKIGFSRKIIIAASLIVAVSLTSISMLIGNLVSDYAKESQQSNIEEFSISSTESISRWLNEKLVQTQAVADKTDYVGHDMDRTILQVMKEGGNYVYVYVANEDGVMVMDDPAEVLPDDYDPRVRPWYIKTKQLMSSSFTEPYVDATSGQVLVSATAPITKNGKLTGVAASDISLDFIANTLSSINFSGTGLAYLVNADGKVLVHKNTKLNEKNISEIYNIKDLKPKSELVEVETDQGIKLIGFYDIKGVESIDWKLAIEVDQDKAFKSVSELNQLSIILTPVFVLISIFIIAFMLKRLMKPLVEIGEAMKEISSGEGDLTKRLTVKNTDEIGTVATHFNLFVGNIHAIMTSFKGQSQEMNGIVHNMSDIATRSRNEMEKTKVETEQVAAAVTEMSTAASEIAQSSQNAASSAQSADDESKDAIINVTKAVNSIDGLAGNLNDAEEVISKLEKEVEGITSVLDVINSIAEQTNLLALNAAIEAARAGEKGRGFAVVADEVRNLAGKTQQSTEEINDKIESLKNRSQLAVAAMAKSKSQSELTVQEAETAKLSLDRIAEAISQISDMNIAIATASEEQTSVTEEIARNVNGIADSTEETTRASIQAMETSEQLSNVSEKIDENVKKFTL